MNPKDYLRMVVLAAAAAFVTPAHGQNYFDRLSMEGVDLYGAISYGVIDEFTNVSPGLYRFNPDARYTPQYNQTLINAAITGGLTYHDGKIYTNQFEDSYQAQTAHPHWRVYDADTYELLSDTELPDNCVATTRSIAFDPVSGKVYGINYTYTETYFVEIDPATGDMTRIGERLDPGARFMCLACNSRGQLYCIYLTEDPRTGDQTQYLAKIQKTSGRIAVVGKIEPHNLMPEDLLINMKYKQALLFDNSKNKMYWIFGSSSYYLGSEYTAICEVDPVGAGATLVAYLTKPHHISGAFLREPAMEAPAVATDFSFTPDAEGSLTGSVSVTLPSTSYNGADLDAGTDLTVTISENGALLTTLTGRPGEVATATGQTFSNDLHNVKVTVSNAAGTGPAISRSFYAGYDLPDVCRNIVLKADGLTTTLTWDMPDKGQNGAPIRPETYTYEVIRWPGEQVVATGLTERTFTETHPADMTRYVYAVTACDNGRRGRSAFSNNYIVGTPLDVPYGGIFKTVADMYNYYTILDVNADNYTWNYDKNTAAAYYDFSMEKDADDWLVSPPINLKAGREYELSFKAYSTLDTYPESMEVCFGPGRTPAELSTQLLDLPVVPSVDEDHPVTQYTVPVKVTEDGVYHYGFHVYTERFHEYLFIFDIKIAKKGGSGVTTVASDAAPVAVGTDGRCICITNPAACRVDIYDMAGHSVASTAETSARFDVTPGIYLVRADGHASKIIVK